VQRELETTTDLSLGEGSQQAQTDLACFLRCSRGASSGLFCWRAVDTGLRQHDRGQLFYCVLQDFLKWRDPESNRGHHDFQTCPEIYV
jgi:hypothetical protein